MSSSNGERPEPTLVELAKQCMADSERWFGDTDIQTSIPYFTLAMCGEVGEFANIIKKIERGDFDFNDPKVRYDAAMELTDVFVYLLELSALMRINLYQSYMIKRGINEERFTKMRTEREASAD